MAISNIGTQDGTQNGTQDDVQTPNPQTANPPVDTTTQENVEENQEIDLNLDLSDIKDETEDETEDENETENENEEEDENETENENEDEEEEETSLNLENNSVAEINDQQINFQDVEVTEKKEDQENTDQENIDQENTDQENIDQENIDQENTDQENTDQENTDQENIDQESEDLSMELPTEVPSKEEDKEWLQTEDKETVKEEKNIEEKSEETTDLGGLDLSAISQAKFNEGVNKPLSPAPDFKSKSVDLPLTGEKLADDTKETVVETAPPVMQSGGMLNLDDLGAMSTPTPVQAAPEITSVDTSTPVVVQEATPVTAVPVTPVAPEVPVAVETPVPVAQEPVVAAPQPQQAVMNQELTAAYDAVATPPAQAKGLHNNVSGPRKIISIVVLVTLMLGGGFYIFKTMFPDKAQNIISQNSIEIETPELIELNETPEIPEAPIVAVATGTVDIPEAIVITSGSNTVVSVSGLGHSVADTGDTTEEITSTGDEFDPFSEIENILDKPSPYQAKIDILEMLLKSGEEYFELGDMAEDATILKYSRVLVQKIPTDIEILEVGADIDMTKIDQHIKLFETYLEKLEALASIE